MMTTATMSRWATAMPQDRIINFNVGPNTPHRVQQHGLRLVQRKTKMGFGLAEGAPGFEDRNSTPASCHQILIDPVEDAPTYQSADGNITMTLLIPDGYAFHIAHELSHGCSVWHHGDRDIHKIPWVAGMDTNSGQPALFEGNQLISVQTEKGVVLPNQVDYAGPEIYVGVFHGQHSGAHDCYMRYGRADAAKATSDPAIRHWISGSEPRRRTSVKPRREPGSMRPPALLLVTGMPIK
jgi:hypothetical protein